MHCRKFWIVASLVLAAAMAVGLAQSPLVPQVTTAKRHDVSQKLQDMAPSQAKAPGPDREIPLRIPPGRPDRPDMQGVPDPLRQTQDRPFPNVAATPQPTTSFDGLNDDDNAAFAGGRIVPPDTEGDVGVNYYVQFNNLVFAIFSKDGSDCDDLSGQPGCIATNGGPFAGNAVWSGFGGLCETTNSGDPIVLYDHLAGRWFYSQFAVSGGTIISECVALSQGGDPRGPFDRWEFDVTPTSTEEPDYPKFGVWPDGYYLSSRDFPAASASFAGAAALDRTAMLAGDAAPRLVKFNLPCLSNDCPDAIQPSHLEGPPPAVGAPNIFTRSWDDDFEGPLTGGDGYRMWAFSVDWSVNPPTASFTELSFVPSIDGFDSTMCGFFQRNCVIQPSPGERVDPIDELQMYRAQYRSFATHDSIVLSTTVDATGGNVAGVRWAELRNSGGGWSLFQEGTYAPADGNNRWTSSIAMDSDGNIALGYSVSSSATFPSVRYTSRMDGDPAGTMSGGEVELVAGSSVQTGSFNRWGDYSTMSVDPVDGCTFWYTQEYQADDGDGSTSFDFKTRIGSFKLPGCGVTGPVCGDGLCEQGEDCASCAADCEITSPGASCGNGVCEAGNGENCLTCAADCNGRQNGNPNNRFCCGDGIAGDGAVTCADSRCSGGGITCTNDPVSPGVFCCGDEICDSGESCSNCALDCTLGAELCSGGVDEDCDGLVDCDDSDCSADSACACGGSGATCSADDDCCSNKCKNGTCRGN